MSKQLGQFITDNTIANNHLTAGAKQGVLQSKLIAERDAVAAFSATSSAQVVTTQVTAVAITPTPQTSLTALGIYTGTVSGATDAKRVLIRAAGTSDGIDDGTGKDIYGVLSEAAGVYTLTYKKADGSSFTFGGATSIDFFFVEIFDLYAVPVSAFIEDGIGGVIDATSAAALLTTTRANFANVLAYANVAGTYANGAAGVGATITAGSNGLFPTTDGVVLAGDEYIALVNQSSSFQNGLYQLTQPGDGSTPYILTRVPFMNSPALMKAGTPIFVAAGTFYGTSIWVLQSNVTTVGTTGVTFLPLGMFLSTAFGVRDTSDPSKLFRMNVSGVSPSNTRTLTMPDYDVDLGALGTGSVNTGEALASSNVSGTYANGAAGVGATITATGNGAFPTTDGVPAVVGLRVLLTAQSTSYQNGLYTLTQVGDGSNPYILTRATGMNTPASLTVGTPVFIGSGNIYSQTIWLSVNPVTTIGADAITFGTLISFFTNYFTLRDGADPTKALTFDTSGIATGQTRTITMPDYDVDLGLVLPATRTLGVTYASVAALPACTYNNGTAGVGATLTGNSNGAIPSATSDGAALSNGDLFLVQNESTSANRGLYVVTQAGSGGAPFILTRSTDFDSPSEMKANTAFRVAAGLALGGAVLCLAADVTTVGTTGMSFAPFLTTLSPAYLDAPNFRDGTDHTKKTAFDSSAVATATTRTLAMPDRNVSLDNVLVEAVEILTLSGTDITNKYIDLAAVPKIAGNVSLFVKGSGPQVYTDDYTVITNGSDIRRLNWDTLGLDGVLIAGNKLVVRYLKD